MLLGMTRRQLLYATLRRCGAVRSGPIQAPQHSFAIADDWGWPHAGAYGCTWVNTPAFDRVANEGILFANCFTRTRSFPVPRQHPTGRQHLAAGRAKPFRVSPQMGRVPGLLEESRYRVATPEGAAGDYRAGGLLGWKPAG